MSEVESPSTVSQDLTIPYITTLAEVKFLRDSLSGNIIFFLLLFFWMYKLKDNYTSKMYMFGTLFSIIFYWMRISMYSLKVSMD